MIALFIGLLIGFLAGWSFCIQCGIRMVLKKNKNIIKK